MNELWWLIPLIIVTDIALVVMGYHYAARRRAVRGVSEEQLKTELDTLRGAMEGLDGCLATVDRALRARRDATHHAAAEASQGRAHPESAGPVRADPPEPDGDGRLKGYAIARRLARKGASAEELMNDCGLTRGEAELIHNLHGLRA